MLAKTFGLRARNCAQTLRRHLESLAEALADTLANGPHGSAPSSPPSTRVPVPVRAPVPSRGLHGLGRARTPFYFTGYGINQGSRGAVRNYSTNPFNPFTLSRQFLRSTQSFWLHRLLFSRNPATIRYRWFKHFLLMKQFLSATRGTFANTSGRAGLKIHGHNTHRILFRSHSLLANSVWNFSAFRMHHHGHRLVGRSIIQSKAFFLSGLYRAAFPQTSARLFTTYACGPGPVPGFSIQVTSETIKNLAISFRTLFNLDNAYRPPSDEGNQFHPYKNARSRGHSRHVKSGIRLNQSLRPEHAARTLAIGGSSASETEYSDNGSESLDPAIIHGCYVDFALGAELSIPSMTFLTEEILGEINANLTYITRRINELKQDFRNLSELGELPIKYIALGNVIRVYFPNCDYDKLEVLLREKNILGGIIYENRKGPIISARAPSIISSVGAGHPTTAAATAAAVVGGYAGFAGPAGSGYSGITESDLISSLYHTKSSGNSSSEGSSVSFDDDVLSSYGGTSGRGVHPLSDAEVVRIAEFDSFTPPAGPITISDNSDFHWV